jgi:hypothetical protein
MMKLPNMKRKTRETAWVEKVLRVLFPDFPPEYPPEAYRYNPACIRLRVVSPMFREKGLAEKYDMVAPLLEERLPKETWWDVSSLVLLAPEEIDDSLSNLEFETPSLPPDFIWKLARKASRNASEKAANHRRQRRN